jgi:hypothetical protein
MNSTLSRVIGSTLLMSSCLFLSTAAHAEDSSHRQALEVRSRAAGLGLESIELLQRVPGEGARATVNRLRDRWAQASGSMQTRGTAVEEERDGHLRLEGTAGWSLIVHEDGTQVRYRNRALRASHRPSLHVGAQPSATTLEAWGRRFIAEQLAKEIRLGAGERLELLRVAYEREGAQSTQGREPASVSVVGAAVVFTRTLEGVDVVGSGSKVTVFFSTDGQPWGFDYDWPSYQRLQRKQAVLPVKEIRGRARRIGAEIAAGGATSVQQVRWECGYFDPGARHRSAEAPVQAACVAQEVATTIADAARNRANARDGLESFARMEVIPAGVQVESDPRWPQAERARADAR